MGPSRHTPNISPKPRSSLSKTNVGASPILGDPALLRSPEFRHLVNHFANMKCLKAIEEGKLRVIRRGQEPVLYLPRVDIIDDPEAPKMVAIFELPGLVNKEISVTIKDGYLIIHGNRQSPYGDSATEQRSCPSNLNIDPESCRRASMSIRELRFGPFLRRVKIPYGTKTSDVTASLAEGMLRVTWPRSSVIRTDSTTEPAKTESPSPSMSPRSPGSSPVMPQKVEATGTSSQ